MIQMIQILIFIIFGIAIYKNIQRTKERNGTKENNTGSDSMSNQTSVPARPAVSVNRNTQMARPPKQTAVKETKEDSHATTAYLKEKAEEDARQHAKEKFEEQKRLYETRGGLAVAERYLDGDLIPQGRQRVKCGYCGADNLLPMRPGTRYSCYFCREALS